MPLLNFQSRFAPLVESGEKRQTIRAYRKDGRDPKEGDTLHLWTGLRQKGARKLGEAECWGVHTIGISQRARGRVDCRVDGKLIGRAVIDHLARNDGFESWQAMVDWFRSTHGLPFRGLLIVWGAIERGE